MEERALYKKEIKQLKDYITFVSNYLSKLKSRKVPNCIVLVDEDDFLHPGLALKSVPLDSPEGEFRYFSKLKKGFSEILKEGTIARKEALELRLNEPLDAVTGEDEEVVAGVEGDKV